MSCAICSQWVALAFPAARSSACVGEQIPRALKLSARTTEIFMILDP
jgi:hypothetical protein